MDLTAEFLIYATLFRLAIIGAGVFAIVLGYKLFVRGVMPEGRTEGELDAGQIRLTVKNAAPGTCFALFGAAMVSVMLIQGNPELLFDRTAARWRCRAHHAPWRATAARAGHRHERCRLSPVCRWHSPRITGR